MAGAGAKAVSYKVVEISDVTAERIEEALNAWTPKGYRFDSVHFVTQAGNRRPTMAFLMFTSPGGRRGARE